MLLPLLLIVLAMGAAAIVAYGTLPALAQYSNGMEMIMLARRMEWPLIVLSLLLCMVLLGLVIANKRRAWWLIGLAPVFALFVHRFAPPGQQRLYVLGSPEFVAPSADASPRDDQWVVGIVFEDQSYALPYSSLYSVPIVFITDYDKRMMLMWSARANRATAFRITREFKPRDLDIVTAPADTLLVRDRRLGQFIVALTGQTVKGEKPVGFAQPVETTKTTWAQWRKVHPNTKVLRGYENANSPAGPIVPGIAGQLVDEMPAETRIAVVGTSTPIAVPAATTQPQALRNLVGDKTRLLIVRDPATQKLRAYDRNVKEDLFPTFKPGTNRKTPEAVMTDSDSGSWWTLHGKAVDGPLKDSQLQELPIEEDLYWGVMKYWYPKMVLAK